MKSISGGAEAVNARNCTLVNALNPPSSANEDRKFDPYFNQNSTMEIMYIMLNSESFRYAVSFVYRNQT